ncbi:flagellar export chaperone FliS [Mariprofundus ferrooxydans]|uniref:Flagellar secretion chaperone FliS n=1 Tax=Mariprofundus ferrooxydans PV-1 TaxID=314345 RepID=Q0F275_9PROT|nr:flagellar export chaperone FliS [Mariprofundus ferrooxydans]EAU55675.1 flagellar protein FliS [Mariprofundus ferrooxydans PV-1]KON48597.1 flagellar protein FliS [Mariprofundus ferrooxydans]
MTRYQAYQGNQVEGAGPLGLVLLTYEALFKSLGRTRMAILAADMSAEATHTSRAVEALIELNSSLNMEAGGDIAQSLASLYIYMMNRLSNGLCSASTEHVDEVIRLVQELREGWMQLSAQQQAGQQRSHLKVAVG